MFDPVEILERQTSFDATARRLRDADTGRFTGWQQGNAGAAARILRNLGFQVRQQPGPRQVVIPPEGGVTLEVTRGGLLRMARERYDRAVNGAA